MAYLVSSYADLNVARKFHHLPWAICIRGHREKVKYKLSKITQSHFHMSTYTRSDQQSESTWIASLRNILSPLLKVGASANVLFSSTTDLRARFGARNHRKSGIFIDQYKNKMRNRFREKLTQYSKRPVIPTEVSKEEVNVFYVTLMAY